MKVKTFKVIEYSCGDFLDRGYELGYIKAESKDKAWELLKSMYKLKESDKYYYSITEF